MVVISKISKKPATESIRKAFINKNIEREKKDILLRIPQDAVDLIDEIIKTKMGMTRTQWILQSIQKSLKEDGIQHG
jgi:hypothetical protein